MATDFTEKRSEPRYRVLLRGKLVYEDGLISVDATVKNSSAHGAHLVLSQPQLLPSELFLLDLRAGIAHEARIIWRKLPDIGVRFSKSHRLDAADTPELRLLQRMWRALALPVNSLGSAAPAQAKPALTGATDD